MERVSVPENQVNDYLAGREFDMVVTSTDIDIVIKYFSDIMQKAINITFTQAYTLKGL